MSSLEGVLFFLLCAGFLTGLVFYTVHRQKLKDATYTVKADKRSELQYDLRRTSTNKGNANNLLLGVIVAIGLVFVIGILSEEPQKREKEIHYHPSQSEKEDENSIIE